MKRKTIRYRWLGSYKDANLAQIAEAEAAKDLVKYGMAEEFSVGIETDMNGHNVYLYKRQ